MNIIVVGCGKIGSSIVASLVREGYDITSIDANRAAVTDLCNMYDVNGIVGYAADVQTLIDAGVKGCDLFVAATGSDEVNLLSCYLARSNGAKHTIARVRNPIYSEKSINDLRTHLGLDDIINPEYYTARELFHLLQLPAAAKIETFSGRSFEMVEILLREGSPLAGIRLMDLRARYNYNVLICAVRRGEDLFIPDGNFVLQPGDRVGLTAVPSEMNNLFHAIGLSKKQARSVMILGGSKTAYYLAKRLSGIGCSVKIIEKDGGVCHTLSEALPKSVVIIGGDGAQPELLREEGIHSTDAFVALTGMDEENILISVFAMSQNVPKVIAKVNRDEIALMAGKLGLESVVSPKKTIADILVRRARSISQADGSDMESLYTFMDGNAEAIEFSVRGSKKLVAVPLRALELKKNILIAGIVRGRKTFIPDGDSILEEGDRVIVLSRKSQRLRSLADILK